MTDGANDIPDLDLVRVVWVDAEQSGSWHDKNEMAELKLPIATSVGRLFKKDKDKIILVLDTTNDGSCGGVTIIPRGMIKEITTLRQKMKTQRKVK